MGSTKDTLHRHDRLNEGEDGASDLELDKTSFQLLRQRLCRGPALQGLTSCAILRHENMMNWIFLPESLESNDAALDEFLKNI